METKVTKSCGCFDLRKGSIAVGIILWILEAVKLAMYTKDLIIYTRVILEYGMYTVDGPTALISALISEVAQILQILFILILVVALLKNNRSYIKVFLVPLLTCYIIDTVLLIFVYCYFRISLNNIIRIILFCRDVAIMLLTPYFLILVRSCYRPNDTNELLVVENEEQNRPFIDGPNDYMTTSNQEDVPETSFLNDNLSNGKEMDIETLYPRLSNFSSDEVVLPKSFYYTSGLNNLIQPKPFNTIVI